MRVLQQPCPVPGLSVCPCAGNGDIEPWRIEVVHEALTWLRTPYLHHAGVKGAGCDCAYLLIRCFTAAGVVPDVDPGAYPPDWHLHKDAERYIEEVLRHCEPAGDALPGDLALYRFGRTVSHGAIVVSWPLVIHAVRGQGVILSDASLGEWPERFAGFYRKREE